MPILYNMNFKRIVVLGGLLALALGGPISLFSASDVAVKLRKTLFGDGTTKAVAPQQHSDPLLSVATPPLAIPAATPPLDAMPTPTLAEVLRFDVSVDWVMHRWPRVSTGLPHLQLQGYRVPLVSGTSYRDVAGSLTYYFNAGQQVERITLRGTTGDPSALVAILTGSYRFARRLTNDPGVVLYEAVDPDNRPAGELKIRSAKVVKATQPYSRFEVELVMDRPRE
jgi:hypothetical protein